MAPHGSEIHLLGPNWSFLCQRFTFLVHFEAIPDQRNNVNEVPRWFSDMWVPELLLPQKIIRMFGPKMAIYAPKYAFLSTYSPCRLIWCPVDWLWFWLWRVGCILQHTYLLYLFNAKKNHNLQLLFQNWNIAINFEALRPFFKCRKLHGFCRNCFASKTGLGIFLWQISGLWVHIR